MPAIDDLVGNVLVGRYELRALLGRGSFGAVYRSWDRQQQQTQAVKILFRDRFDDPPTRNRFLREAQILGELDHPHIVKVNDFGIDAAESRAYLVMPYISGGTLQDLLPPRQGLLDLDEVLRLFAQLCEALDYIHVQKIVHLDLKPQNILRSQTGELVLADFGLAHWFIGGKIWGGSSVKLGTPFFMAPEHLDGKPTRLSDVYALGVILYYFLAGRVPFGGSLAQIIVGHQLKPPPSLAAIRSDLSSNIDEVIRTALAKQPADRYSSANALLAAVTAALRPPVPQLRAARWSRPGSSPVDPFGTTEQVQHPPVIDVTEREPAPVQHSRTLWQTLPVWLRTLTWLQYMLPMAFRFLLPAALGLLAHAGLQWFFWVVMLPFLRGQPGASHDVISLWVGLLGGGVCGLLALLFAKEVRGYGFSEEALGWRCLNYLSTVLGWLSGGGLAMVCGHALGTWVRLFSSEWFFAAADAVLLVLGVFAFIQHDMGTGVIETALGGVILAGVWIYYWFHDRGWWR